MTPHLAVLDDEPRLSEVLAMVLRRDGYQVSAFTDPRRFVETLAGTRFDLLLTDLKMPQLDGLEVLRLAKQSAPEMPVILVTAHATVHSAIEAMKRGAFDYIEKPVDNDVCRALVRRALDLTHLERENRYLREELRQRYSFDKLVASAPAMRQVIDLARRAAQSRATVLLQGESGTGKELFARAIHFYSDRIGHPFVAVNCKAFAAGILESELFGHEKGAFTGASNSRAGIFEQAHGGTLFLDEIGEVDLSFQAKLLRVLQEREVIRVGGDSARSVDVRVVAATNRELMRDVGEGRFREDLYYRLAVIPIQLPPLRDRPEDLLPLARSFLVRISAEIGRSIRSWSPAVEAWLLHHDWPGNVRELENLIERAVVLARTETIELGDLLLPASMSGGEAGEPTTATASDTRTPRSARSEGASAETTGPTEPLALHDYLDGAARDHIARVLERCHGVRVDAAQQLGIERTTLYRLMKKYGLTAEEGTS